MDKKSVFGELLYIGLVVEKGRCKSKGIWNLGYKRTLIRHLTMLYEISECIQDEEVSKKDSIVLRKFIKLWETEMNIRKFYPIKKDVLIKLKQKEYNLLEPSKNKNNNHLKVSRLMSAIIKDTIELLNKPIFVNKRKVSMFLKASHNLPRYYLDQNAQTLCRLSQPSIEYKDAIEYCFTYMDEKARQKYQIFIN